MKKINFIQTLTPRQQNSIHRWYRVSWGLCVIMIVVIGVMQVKQLLTLRSSMHKHGLCKQQGAAVQDILQKVDRLKVQEKSLNHHYACIAEWKANQKRTTDYVQALSKMIATKHLTLESLMEKNATLELVVYCTNTDQALSLASNLAQLPHLQALRLVSLQPSQDINKTVVATYRGSL